MKPDDAFFLMFAFCCLWVAGWIVISIVHRRSAGKPLFPGVPPGARFSAIGVSGRSLRNLLTRIGGARNCLIVAVDGNTLRVAPVFPFNLLFLPEIYDLEHTVPLSRISSAEVRKGIFGSIADIRFAAAGGDMRHIELRLSNAEALIAALKRRDGTQ